MRRSFFLFEMALLGTIVTIVSCSKLNYKLPVVLTKENTLGNEDYYYWYNGEKVTISISGEYFNVYGDPQKSSTIREYCESHSLILDSNTVTSNALTMFKVNSAATKTESDFSYSKLAAELKEDGSGVKVFPVVNRVNGTPIETSHLFYVKLMGENNYAKLKEFADGTGTKIVSDIDYMPGWYVLSMENSVFDNSIQASNYYMETGLFEKVDPAFIFDFQPSVTVNDVGFNSQWGLKNTQYSGYDINVESAWDLSKGKNVSVAVVDTGIDSNHPDLKGNLTYHNYNSMTSSTSYRFNNLKPHGTHVSGIIAAMADNTIGIAGVAPESMLMDVYHDLSISKTATLELAGGINWAWANGADIINCSWGDQGGEFDSLHSSLLEEAILNAIQSGRNHKGAIVIFAAGNSGGVLDYPGNFDERILTVGAIGKTGHPSDFSAFGNRLDVVAPGESILSTLPGGFTEFMSGTSMAAPMVSGIAALILSINPQLNGQDVIRIIELTSNKINPGGDFYYGDVYFKDSGEWNEHLGYGLVNAARAVLYANTSANVSLSNGGGSLSLVSQSGAFVSMSQGYVYSNSLSDKTYYVSVDNLSGDDYQYFWQVFPYQNGYTVGPRITTVYGQRAILELPEGMTRNTSYMIRCCVFEGDRLIGAPSFNLYVN